MSKGFREDNQIKNIERDSNMIVKSSITRDVVSKVGRSIEYTVHSTDDENFNKKVSLPITFVKTFEPRTKIEVIEAWAKKEIESFIQSQKTIITNPDTLVGTKMEVEI